MRNMLNWQGAGALSGGGWVPSRHLGQPPLHGLRTHLGVPRAAGGPGGAWDCGWWGPGGGGGCAWEGGGGGGGQTGVVLTREEQRVPWLRASAHRWLGGASGQLAKGSGSVGQDRC